LAEHYRFFDSTDEDVREYRAAEFAEYFAQFLTSGVFNSGDTSPLLVTASGTNMKVSINPGYAFIKGYLYKVSDTPHELVVQTADPSLDRIDRVVIRLDLVNRNIKAMMLAGTPAAEPVAPNITRTDTVFDISLAQVRVTAAQSIIPAQNVTDERMLDSVCGYVNSLIKMPTDSAWNDWLARKAQINADWSAWYDQVRQKYSEVAYQDTKKLAFFIG
jgi:hypothetical protein